MSAVQWNASARGISDGQSSRAVSRRHHSWIPIWKALCDYYREHSGNRIVSMKCQNLLRKPWAAFVTNDQATTALTSSLGAARLTKGDGGKIAGNFAQMATRSN